MLCSDRLSDLTVRVPPSVSTVYALLQLIPGLLCGCPLYVDVDLTRCQIPSTLDMRTISIQELIDLNDPRTGIHEHARRQSMIMQQGLLKVTAATNGKQDTEQQDETNNQERGDKDHGWTSIGVGKHISTMSSILLSHADYDCFVSVSCLLCAIV